MTENLLTHYVCMFCGAPITEERKCLYCGSIIKKDESFKESKKRSPFMRTVAIADFILGKEVAIGYSEDIKESEGFIKLINVAFYNDFSFFNSYRTYQIHSYKVSPYNGKIVDGGVYRDCVTLSYSNPISKNGKNVFGEVRMNYINYEQRTI